MASDLTPTQSASITLLDTRAARAIQLIPLIPGAVGVFSMPTVRIPPIPGLVKTLGGQPMAQFKEATLTTGEKIIVNVDEIRLMHWIQDATTIRFAKDHGVQIKETPEHLMMSKTLRNM